MPLFTQRPFPQMITNTSERNHKCIACPKTTIGKVVRSWRDSKIYLAGIFEDTPISRTPFPPTEHIAEPQVEGTCSEDILRNATLSIPIARDIFARDKRLDVRTINSTQTSFKEWKEVGIVVDPGWYLVRRRKFNVSIVECLRYDHIKQPLKNPILRSVHLLGN